MAGSAVALALLLSLLVMGVGGVFAPQMLAALGTPAPILGESIVYARVLLLSAPVFFLLWLATAVSRAVGDAKTPLHAAAGDRARPAVHATADPRLGGLPQLGAASAAVSAAFASLLALVWLLWSWHRLGHPLAPGHELLQAIRFDGAIIRSMLRIGVPSSLQMLSLAIAEIVLLGWISRYGYRHGGLRCGQPVDELGAAAGHVAGHHRHHPRRACDGGRTCGTIARHCPHRGAAGPGDADGRGAAGDGAGAVADRPDPGGAGGARTGALQLRTVVWGVLAMGGTTVLVGVMRGSGTVLLPALLGMTAVLLLELPLAMWLQARHGLTGLWWAWPLGLVAMLVLQMMCFARWRSRLPAAA